MRKATILAIALVLIAPLALASEPSDLVDVRATLGEAGAADAVNYRHDDCVGPGLPGLAGPHGTHTTRVSGFVINPSRPVSFGYATLNPFAPGLCPTTIGGPILQHDFTGRLTYSVVCRGTLNDGGLFFSGQINAVGGLLTGTSFLPGTCTGYLNAPFSLDVTITITATTFNGLQLGPVGGVGHTLSQA